MLTIFTIVNKVIYESDIVLEILDARLIDASRNLELEMKIAKAEKVLLFVMNKCDLIDKLYLQQYKRKLRPSVFISSKKHLGGTILKKKILGLVKK